MMKVDRFVLRASELLGKNPDEVTKEERQGAKQVYFAEMHETFTCIAKAEITRKLNRCVGELTYLEENFSEEPLLKHYEKRLLIKKEIEVLEDVLEIIDGD